MIDHRARCEWSSRSGLRLRAASVIERAMTTGRIVSSDLMIAINCDEPIKTNEMFFLRHCNLICAIVRFEVRADGRRQAKEHRSQKCRRLHFLLSYGLSSSVERVGKTCTLPRIIVSIDFVGRGKIIDHAGTSGRDGKPRS